MRRSRLWLMKTRRLWRIPAGDPLPVVAPTGDATLITEGSDTLITEAGDALQTE